MYCRRYGEAWAALAAAKQLHGPGPQYRPDDYAAELRQLRSAFPAAAQGQAGAGSQAGRALRGVADLAGRLGLLRLQQWIGNEPAAAAAGAEVAPGGACAQPASAGQAAVLRAARAAGPAPPGPRPILLVGLPRSGGTLLEQVLSRRAGGSSSRRLWLPAHARSGCHPCQ